MFKKRVLFLCLWCMIFSFAAGGVQRVSADEELDKQLRDAVLGGDVTEVRQLLKAGANAYAHNSLHMAALAGRSQVVQVLVEAGVRIDAKDAYGTTPLTYAMMNGHANIVGYLYGKGARADSRSKDGEIPFDIAGRKGYAQAVYAMEVVNAVRAGQDKDKDKKPAPPATLYDAARRRDDDAIESMLAKKMDVNQKDEDGWTALHYAAIGFYYPTLNVLLDGGADMEAMTNHQMTPLALAANFRDMPALLTLLKKGAKVDTIVEGGTTAIWIAALANHPDVVEMLQKAGAKAIVPGMNEKICSLSLILGMNREIKGVKTEIDTSIIQFLLDAGADIESKAGMGTPLCAATLFKCSPEKVEVLLKNGADVNAQGLLGRTPLHFAVSNGDLKSVQLLLAAGADPEAKDPKGTTPMFFANHNRIPAIIDALQKAIDDKK